ncbi:hypothetical protein VNI00_017716 [Paramarasmius palmivorus]|uniref:Uncharacterized protein n=1 Tax=Paramarasmius palmivorus TaxID=297713 RepID=A0AAW0B4I0_9AGAR
MPRKGQKVKSVDGEVSVATSKGSVVGERSVQGSVRDDTVEGSGRKKGSRALDAAFSRPIDNVTVIEDDSDSDRSIVSVSRAAAPKVERKNVVRKFGTVDSDEEVHLAVRDKAPRLSSLVRDGAVVDSFEDPTNSDKKRRMSTDINMSPSKIRVQDLSLSPRKTIASAVNGTDKEADEHSGKRTSGRVRKPTHKVELLGRAQSGTLLEKLDALSPEPDESSAADCVTDSSYRPSVSRSSVKAGRSSGKKRGKGKTALEDDDGDVFMDTASPRSNGEKSGQVANGGVETDVDLVEKKDKAKKPRAPPQLDLRPLSDSDESLPSPGELLRSVFAKGARDADVRSGDDAARVGVDSAAVDSMMRPSPEWDEGGGRSSVGGSKVGASVKHGHMKASSSTGSEPGDRHAGEHVSSKIGLLPVDADSKAKAGSVFLSAVPESDDEDVQDDDLEVAQQHAEGSGVVPLLNSDLIHPDLVEVYASVSWINHLRRCKFIGYSNTEDAFDGFAAISYGVLLDSVNPRVRSKLVRSMLFKEYKVFKNLSRVSLAGHVAQGREVGESMVKQLHIRPIENDWDILQCNMGSYFNDVSMHAPGRNSALVFQTKRQGWSPRKADQDKGEDKLASTPYALPVKGGTNKMTPKIDDPPSSGEEDIDVSCVNILESGVPPYRLFEEGIPLYDGRTRPGVKGFRFEPGDWEKYTLLPRYPFPEVEDRSLVTLVYTLTGFRIGKASHHTVHFNALFAIVLGKVDV